ncbi:hypothetical protein WJ0W_003151 [Paenibacillus melissococcoides]|uniref:Lipoprotein n=1 Tax=Paenibacillus melissococcoides TaxID=2912268 RepID=A0ABN8U4B8_9BACL|nr:MULTISPECIES: hypothetical protein [Paenibacillus]MEB9892263.1 hypothetical protein [Bacillus cereus]CAH8245916.1 hypothetical protein WJ0W_003151 [Paenibacillus melissococcoides]CAH8712456.1 hypothetical protein WDD9_003234 [Paenibacillus melissococcoides]CAH8713202.1 hypothetical protein HTL2_003537 [Paenibacillus melissococcoides]GIO77541.1 hypothetical protein J6TS7_11510 [Paenibacillus dendritiformis]
MKKTILVLVSVIFLLTACGTTPSSSGKEGKKVTVQTVLQVMEETAPPPLTKETLEQTSSIPLFLWLRDVESWTNGLLRYSQRLILNEEDKKAFLTALGRYYSEEQAKRLFDSYFQAGSEGNYSLKEQESFGVLSSIHFGLKSSKSEADGRYEIHISGQYSDSLEELIEVQVEETVTILADKLLIAQVEAVRP